MRNSTPQTFRSFHIEFSHYFLYGLWEVPNPLIFNTASEIDLPEVTEGTEEGLLPGVNSHVQVQLLLGDELFVAKRTQKIQRAVVTLLTSDKLLLIPENIYFSFLLCGTVRAKFGINTSENDLPPLYPAFFIVTPTYFSLGCTIGTCNLS